MMPLHSLFVRLTLLAAGFIFGTFGIAALTHFPAKDVVRYMLFSRAYDQLGALPSSAACRLDPQAETPEIFFISCGGIF